VNFNNFFINFVGINDHNDVYQECKQFSAKWDIIGLSLGVTSTTIAIINRDNSNSCERCMSEMLAKWLQRENEKCIPSWRSLCQAVCAEVDRSTADKIAEKYCVTNYNKRRGTIVCCQGSIDSGVNMPLMQ